MSQTRRLAAILAADVARYSRLMGADEEGTHEGLQAHLREFVNPTRSSERGFKLQRRFEDAPQTLSADTC
jgi:class 3 adenylate cyclase